MTTNKYIYWLEQAELQQMKTELKQDGYKIGRILKTPCEVLNAKDNKVLFAAPSVWNLVCKRQGSWYRESDKNGKYMLVSDHKLNETYNRYLDAEITESDFMPPQLPSRNELKVLVTMPDYIDNKPAEWENIGAKDSILFKSLFTLTGFWKWGDNMKRHWLHQRSNHANFLTRQYTTEIDNQQVPYSVTDNDGVCSSCVEFFNVLENNARKLVRACPGAITFGGVKRTVYYDVKPQHV